MSTVIKFDFKQREVKQVEIRKSPEEEKLIADVKEVLEFMNEKCKSNYQLFGRKDKDKFGHQSKYIANRLEDGYTIQELKGIIAFLNRKWGGDPKMHMFLRPQTLFGPENIERYLGAPKSEM